MSCANHICNAPLSGEADHVACSLCKAAVYCSTKCQAMDWLKHDCPNVVHVDHVDAQVMVPYYYEDRLPVATVEKLNVQDPVFAAYSIVHHGTNQVVSHRIQEPLLYNLIGAAEEQQQEMPKEDVKYTVTITTEDGQKHVISGSSLKDVVLAANKHNTTAAKLAAAEPVEGALYWKPIAKEIRVPLAGALDFTFQMEGKEPISIGGLYNIQAEELPALSKEVKKAMDQQLRLKFKTADPTAFRVLQVGDAAGNRVAVAFKLDQKKDTATLADVEFLAAPDSFLENPHKENQMQSVDFECNPRKVEDLVGLTMTLERHIQMNASFLGEQAKVRLETVAGVIHKHTRAILDGKRSVNDDIPAEVDTAIYTAMGELYDLEAIGALAFNKKQWEGVYRDKLARALSYRNKYYIAKEFTDGLIKDILEERSTRDTLQAKRESRKGLKKFFSSKGKLHSRLIGQLMRRVEILKSIIYEQFVSTPLNFKEKVAALDSERSADWADLIRRLSEIRDPNYTESVGAESKNLVKSMHGIEGFEEDE